MERERGNKRHGEKMTKRTVEDVGKGERGE